MTDQALRLGGFVLRAVESLAHHVPANVWGKPELSIDGTIHTARLHLCALVHSFHAAGRSENLDRLACAERSDHVAADLLQLATRARPFWCHRAGLRARVTPEAEAAWGRIYYRLRSVFLGAQEDAARIREAIRTTCRAALAEGQEPVAAPNTATVDPLGLPSTAVSVGGRDVDHSPPACELTALPITTTLSPPVMPKHVGVRSKQSGRKNIDARMLKLLADDLTLYDWTARRFAEHLGCKDGTVKETKAWKQIMAARAARAAERIVSAGAANGGRRRRRN